MSESFTLSGGGTEKTRGPGKGTLVVGLIIGAVLIWVVWRAIDRTPLRNENQPGQQLLLDAEARKQALQDVLPGARLPEPFVLRGAYDDGSTLTGVWMRRDFDDSHAVLFGGESPLHQSDVAELVNSIGGAELPRRQVIDEEGVEIEKRPPFAEEFRTTEQAAQKFAPPTEWVSKWGESVLVQTETTSLTISIEIGDGNMYALQPFQQSGAYWWSLVDLSPRTSDGNELHMFFAVNADDAPTSDGLIGFLEELLSVR